MNKKVAGKPPASEKMTPMMEQFYSIKSKHRDKFIFFRLGDFYELFAEDAIEVSKLLSLTLTHRGGRPMCGVPHHQLRVYAARLIAQGKKIVVVDQTGEAKPGHHKTSSKLVKREVTEILTPGTAHEWETLETKKNNFLLSLVKETDDIFSLPFWTACMVDVSTGEVEIYDCGQGSESFIAEKVTAMGIREVLLPKNSHMDSLSAELQEKSETIVISTYGGQDSANFESASIEDLEEILHKFYSYTSTEELAFAFKESWGLLASEKEESALSASESFQKKHLKSVVSSEASTATSCYHRYLRMLVPLLSYISEEQLRAINHLKVPTLFKTNEYLVLDAAAIRNLELFQNNYDHSSTHTLVSVLDETQTAMGGRLLRRVMLRPFAQKTSLDERLLRVSWFIEHSYFLDQLRTKLNSVQDIERLMGRLGMGKIFPKELRGFTASLVKISEVFDSFLEEELSHRKETSDANHEVSKVTMKTTSDFFWAGEGFYPLQRILLENPLYKESSVFKKIDKHLKSNGEAASEVSLFYQTVLWVNDMAQLIDKTLLDDPQNDFVEGGVIRETATEELQKLHEKRREQLQQLTQLWKKEKEKTGIPSLKLKYTDNMGYFFEVTKANATAVPDYFQRKQTLVGGERFMTSELLELEKKTRENLLKITEVEKELYQNLLQELRTHIPIFQQLGNTLGFIDLWSTFAFLALKHQYTRPKFVDNATFIYEGGRHPVIERIDAEPFVANSLRMNKQTSALHIITGPNMAGKSTFLRQTVLIALMAHMGSYVPAQKAELPVLDRIFTRIGANDRLSKGESTFLVEMNETADILRNATKRSLVIMDEIGRGTSTYDGLSIAWSVLEYLTENAKQRPYTLFATHYHELTELSHITGVENFHLKIKEEGSRLLFLKRVAKGNAGKSYGVHVARLAGIPESVIVKAQERLRYFEKKATVQCTSTQTDSLITTEEIKKLEIALESERQFNSKIKQFFHALDINNLTPLEALHKLSELSKKI